MISKRAWTRWRGSTSRCAWPSCSSCKTTVIATRSYEHARTELAIFADWIGVPALVRSRRRGCRWAALYRGARGLARGAGRRGGGGGDHSFDDGGGSGDRPLDVESDRRARAVAAVADCRAVGGGDAGRVGGGALR